MRGEIFQAEIETADLWQPKWNENQTVLSEYHTYPRQGCRSPSKHSRRELEFRDCGAIPGQGLLLTLETDRGDVREEVVVGNACGGKPGTHGSKEILVTCRGWICHHSLSPPTASIDS